MTLEKQILQLIQRGCCTKARLYSALPMWTKGDIRFVLGRLIFRGHIVRHVGHGYRIVWSNSWAA